MESIDSDYSHQNPEDQQLNDDDSELTSKKQEQNAKEREEILASVSSNSIRTTKEKVAYILNKSIEARNSDIDLAWEYWTEFESSKFNGRWVTKDELRALTGIKSLCRSRAKIQNEYKLYLADAEVRAFRGTLKDEIKKESVEDKPHDLKLYSVYIDETGKNDNYICVGSVWLLDAGSSVISLQRELEDWCKSKGVNFEFHFSKLNTNRLEVYKEFFTLFLEKFPSVSFKAIILNNRGFKDTRPVITDLTYHLINKGIDHEHFTNRAPLPRIIQVWVDEDEKGSDTLKLENVRERLENKKSEGLELGYFAAVNSKNNFFIQMADLFTGAINRKVNISSTGNFKDEFADFVLSITGFDLTDIDLTNTQADNAKVFNLK